MIGMTNKQTKSSGVSKSSFVLRNTLRRYLETKNNDPKHATRADVMAAVNAWQEDQVLRPGSRASEIEGSLTREVYKWIDLDLNDLTQELDDAIELFDLRVKIMNAE
jgi:hypothetical protein